MKKRRQQLLLTGDIGDDTVRGLFNIPDSVRSIELLVHSQGGSFYAAVAICQLFRKWQNRKIRVQTVALGEVCSAATLIVAAGSPGHRLTHASTLWGLHLPYLCGEAPEDALVQKSDARLFATMEKQCYHLLEEMTGRPKKKWQELLGSKSTLWIHGPKAKELGLVDEVLND